MTEKLILMHGNIPYFIFFPFLKPLGGRSPPASLWCRPCLWQCFAIPSTFLVKSIKVIMKSCKASIIWEASCVSKELSWYCAWVVMLLLLSISASGLIEKRWCFELGVHYLFPFHKSRESTCVVKINCAMVHSNIWQSFSACKCSKQLWNRIWLFFFSGNFSYQNSVILVK